MCRPTTPHLLAFDEQEDVHFPPIAPPGGGNGNSSDNHNHNRRRRRRTRVVRFGTVTVFELGMRPGDHPCCPRGAAVELGDELVGYSHHVSVDEYERVARPKNRRGTGAGASRISFEVRRAIWLRHHGVPPHRSVAGRAVAIPSASMRSGSGAMMKDMVLADPISEHVEEIRLHYSYAQRCVS